MPLKEPPSLSRPRALEAGLDSGSHGGRVFNGSPTNQQLLDHFLESYYTDERGNLRYLVVHNNLFYEYSGRWKHVDAKHIKTSLTSFLRLITFFDARRKSNSEGDERPVPFDNTRLNSLVAQLSYCVPEVDSAPCYLARGGDAPTDPFTTISFRNGVLDAASAQATAKPVGDNYFDTQTLERPYDPSASCDSWQAFLQTVSGDDPRWIACLQEWMGYLLLPHNEADRFLFLYGVPRSGKSTIMRIMELLVDRRSAELEMNSFSYTHFGEELVDKKLVTIGDVPRKIRDNSSCVGALKKIVGRSSFSVKFKHISGRGSHSIVFPCKIVMGGNNLPLLDDSSDSLFSKMINLQFSRSFLGNEDTGLLRRLESELPGILAWAVAGARRLIENDYKFTEPDSSVEARKIFREETSPIMAFVNSYCGVGRSFSVKHQDLYTAYCRFCKDHDWPIEYNKLQLWKHLSTESGLILTREYKMTNGDRTHYIQGIGLRPEILSEMKGSA